MGFRVVVLIESFGFGLDCLALGLYMILGWFLVNLRSVPYRTKVNTL